MSIGNRAFIYFFPLQISMSVWAIDISVTSTHGAETLQAHISVTVKRGIVGMESYVLSIEVDSQLRAM